MYIYKNVHVSRQVQVNYGAPPSYDQPPPHVYQPPPPMYSAPPAQTQNTTNVIQVQPGVQPMGQTIIIQQAPEYSMSGHIAFSCVVYWCCNWLFGAIAFFVACKSVFMHTISIDQQNIDRY